MWEYKSGSGRWANYVNSQTGEESIKKHTPLLVKEWCAIHRYTPDIPKNRIKECLVCGQETTFIVGIHEIVDGKIINRAKKS